MNLSDNSIFGDVLINGAEALDVSNVTNGQLVISSTFSSSSKTRRALSTKGGYDIQDKVGFVTFSIDPLTTSGNIVELWMISGTKYIQSTLSITANTFVPRISVAYAPNNSTSPQSNLQNCTFVKGVLYQLKLSISMQNNAWIVKGELYSASGANICSISLPLQQFVSSQFFASSFSFVLSQSPSGTALQRKVKAAGDETMQIKISQMGVQCPSGNCQAAQSSTVKPVTMLELLSVWLLLLELLFW